MLDIKDFNILETQNNFDFKGFLSKLISYWKWFILCLILTFTIAYQVNIRKEKIYGMETLIVVKDENNQLFSSNTSLVFNWGGTSDKVQTIITTLKSRSHNEIVVKNLQFYINYLKETEYNCSNNYETEIKFRVNPGIKNTLFKTMKQLPKCSLTILTARADTTSPDPTRIEKAPSSSCVQEFWPRRRSRRSSHTCSLPPYVVNRGSGYAAFQGVG